MSLKSNQKGFAAIEAILLVVILAIIGGTGYYVYHANKKTDKTLESANSSSGKPAKTGKKKSSQAAPQPAPAVDDKTAILAAIKAKIEPQPVVVDGNTITFTYTVDEISGINARGSIRASEGDPMQYIAQKQNESWQVIYSGHLAPIGPDTCTKYSLPSTWCMTNPY